MKTKFQIPILVCFFVLLSGCQVAPQETADVQVSASHTATDTVTSEAATREIQPSVTLPPTNAATPTETARPTRTATLEPTATNTPLTPGISLPDADQIVFTLPSFQPMRGEFRFFAIGPDGSFWINDIDTDRLLQFDPQGVLLQEISLEGITSVVNDLVVTEQGIWILNSALQSPEVVRIGLDGILQETIKVPQAAMRIQFDNAVQNLWITEDGQVIIHSLTGLFLLEDSGGGEVSAQLLGAISYYGYTYDVRGRAALLVNETPIDIPVLPDYYLIEEPFLGFNPDGSFVVLTHMIKDITQSFEPLQFQTDDMLYYYMPDGTLFGMARPWLVEMYIEGSNHLALGPDGLVYQLVPEPGQPSKIVRLGFAETLAKPTPIPTNTPRPTPFVPPTATWVVPSGGSAAEIPDLEMAQATLIRCLDLLYYQWSSSTSQAEKEAFKSEAAQLIDARDFAEEVGRFPDILLYLDLNPELDFEKEEDLIEFLGPGCNFFVCLRAQTILREEQISATEFQFTVELLGYDDRPFVIEPCCGASPITEFTFTVVKGADGQFRVLDPIIFVWLGP